MPDVAHENPAWRKRAAPFFLVAATFLLATAIINPFREMLWQDDSWSYARMVQHLLSTGQYHLDDWAAANMPTQIYLAAGLSKIFGYSLILLRCTTVALLAVALTSLYLLLRELGHSRQISAGMALVLLASPLVLLLGFSFQSDVQFLGWFLLALWLYVRGFRRGSTWNIFFASLAAGCAIGTRQFGIAIVVGLVAKWVVSASPSRLPLRQLGIAIAAPLVAATAQLIVGFRDPNITQIHRLAETHEMLTLPAYVLVKEFLWRCCAILQYVGIPLLPLLPALLAAPSFFWKHRVGRVPVWVLTLCVAAAIVWAVSFPSVLTARARTRHGLWDSLVLHWELFYYLNRYPRITRLLDTAGIIGGTMIAAMLFSHLRSMRRLRSLPPELVFLVATFLGLLMLHLVYKQLNDTYTTAFVPFALLLVASHLRRVRTSAALLRLSCGLALASMLLMSVRMDADYAQQTASWTAAESLTRAGVDPMNVHTVYPWIQYHGAFSQWVAAGAPGYDLHHRERYLDPLHDPAVHWILLHEIHARYCTLPTPSLDPLPGWRVVSSVPYRNPLFQMRCVRVLERTTAPPGDPYMTAR